MTDSPFFMHQTIFVRRGSLKSREYLQKPQVVRRDCFVKPVDGEEISFIVISLELTRGRIVRAVDDPDCLPFLDEINETLEKIHAHAN